MHTRSITVQYAVIHKMLVATCCWRAMQQDTASVLLSRSLTTYTRPPFELPPRFCLMPNRPRSIAPLSLSIFNTFVPPVQSGWPLLYARCWPSVPPRLSLRLSCTRERCFDLSGQARWRRAPRRRRSARDGLSAAPRRCVPVCFFLGDRHAGKVAAVFLCLLCAMHLYTINF